MTFSAQLLRLYLAIGSEVDVVAKLLCLQIDPTQKPDRITDYQPIITGRYPKLEDLTIHVRGTAIAIKPWGGWNSGKSPVWWGSFPDLIKVLNDNARSPIPLVRNSVAGWIGKFQRGWGMHIVVNQPRINMQWNNISLDINPIVFSESDLFIMSVIVHEFHHVLTERAGPVYEDEF